MKQWRLPQAVLRVSRGGLLLVFDLVLRAIATALNDEGLVVVQGTVENGADKGGASLKSSAGLWRAEWLIDGHNDKAVLVL